MDGIRTILFTIIILIIAEVKVDNVGCWHEPIYNQTLVEIDLQIPNINIDQVKKNYYLNISYK